MVKLSTYVKVPLFGFTMKERGYPQIDYSECEPHNPSVDMIIQHVKLHQVTKVSFKAK